MWGAPPESRHIDMNWPDQVFVDTVSVCQLVSRYAYRTRQLNEAPAVKASTGPPPLIASDVFMPYPVPFATVSDDQAVPDLE